MSDWPRTRTSQRLPVLLAVSYPTSGEMARDVITNVGAGGLFIRTTKPLPIGTQIEMAIQIVDAEPVIHQKGRVTWTRGLGGEGMGVRFEDPIDPRIAELLKSKRAENP